MSVSATTSRVQYTLSTTTQTLAVPFYFLLSTHIKVIKSGATQTVLTVGTHYTVSGAGVEAGGSITLTGIGVAVSDKITIKRAVPITQLVDYITNDRFPALTHERALDKLTMICQMLAEEATRALRFEEGEVLDGAMALASRKGKGISFDATTGAVEFIDIQDVLDAADEAAASAASAEAASATAVAAAAAAASYQAKIEFATVAACSAASVAAMATGDIAFVRSFAADGDGAHGFFRLDKASSTTAVAGMILAATGGGRWFRLYAEEVHAVWFGAKFDSTLSSGTDDTTALQAAIDFCLANRARRLVLPCGTARISTPLTVGTATSGTAAQSGFTIQGQGQSTNSAQALHGGTCIDIQGTGKTAAIRVLESCWRFLTITRLSLQCTNKGDADAGILFEESNHRKHQIIEVGFARFEIAIKCLGAGGFNGEFMQIEKCEAAQIRCFFYQECNQSYWPHIKGGWFLMENGGTFIKMHDVAGGLIQDAHVSFEAGSSAPCTIIECRSTAIGSDPIRFLGGRWEGVDRLILATLGSTDDRSCRVIFDGIIATSFENLAGCYAIEVGLGSAPGSNTNSGCSVVVQNSSLTGTADAAPIPFKVGMGYSAGQIIIRDTDFIGLVPVVEQRIGSVAEWTGSDEPSRGRVSIENCRRYSRGTSGFKWFPVGNPLTGGALSGVPKALRQQNLMLKSDFGATATGTDVSAESPWVHYGTDAGFATFAFAFKFNNSVTNLQEVSDYGKKIRFNPECGVYQNLSYVISTAGKKQLHYRARASANGVIRFALVNSATGVIYDECIMRGESIGNTPYDVVLAAYPEALSAGSVRVVIEAPEGGAWLYLSHQSIADRADGAFVATDAATVTRTQGWDPLCHNAKVLNRLQVPLKADSIAADNASYVEAEAEYYISLTTLREMIYTDRWESRPRQDVGAAAPGSGTWPLGFVRWNSAPSAGGTVGWICTTAGTPGTWKTFGAISA